MCNIAGYVGTNQAAPTPIEMMHKEGGLDVGYFETADCLPAYLTAYETLYSLHRQGLLKIHKTRVPGTFEGLEAWQFKLSLQEMQIAPNNSPI